MLAETICRLVHTLALLVKSSAAKGVKTVLRARAFMPNLLLRAQAAGLAEMAQCLSNFVSSPGLSGAPPPERVVVPGVCHGWDESRQMLREHARCSGARAHTQQVARDVLVQTSMVRALCLKQQAGLRQVYNRVETCLARRLK